MSEKERIEVVDHKYTFSMIADAFAKDLRLSAFDRAVYLALKLFAGQKNMCWPSGDTIAQYSGCGRTTAFKALAHLEELGYISRIQRAGKGDFQKTTIYQLNDPEKITNENTLSSPDELSVFARRTLGVRQTNGGCSPDEQEPYTRTIHNEPDNPLDPPEGVHEGEAAFPEAADTSEADALQAGAERTPVADAPAEDDAASRVLSQICADFALSPQKRQRLRDLVIPRWLADCGEAAVVLEVRRALSWNVERGCRKKDPERFIGNWLRRAQRQQEDRGSGAEAPIAVVPRVERAFAEFWEHWPGLKTGREAARRAWYARFSPLAGDSAECAQARSRAYDALEEQISGLMDRADAGEEPRFFGSPAHFIRDADFGERHGAV